MKTDNELCFALSLAQKAGKLASGDQGVWDTLKKKGRARYVLIAADASPRTVERSGTGAIPKNPLWDGFGPHPAGVRHRKSAPGGSGPVGRRLPEDDGLVIMEVCG